MRVPNLGNIIKEYIEPQPWLKRPRNEEPTHIIIHATRGATTPNLQYLATKNWARSVYNQQQNHAWGASFDFIVGNEPGEICQVGPLTKHASWSAGFGDSGTWGADTKSIAIEVAQSDKLENFDPDAIENLIRLCVELVLFYNIPVRRISYLSQVGYSPGGFVGHEDTANGRKTGKSDPGSKFPWDSFIREVNRRVEARRNPTPAPAPPAVKPIGANDGHNARNDFIDLVLIIFNSEPAWSKAELDKWLAKWGYLFR